ncbi:MAG: DNA polymerase IV [Candidatus Izimaplasma sp.]|nr:DNA polymerase IV [Candidatus Izimaplasma bacterium]
MEKKYRIIFHIDLNAFFASCEMAEDAKLLKIPLGIGGRRERGVLTTANYVARKFGVKSGMNSIEAKRLCPKLLILPVNFDLYHKYSKIFFDLLSEYSDSIEKGSIDEGYLDMTDLSDEVHPLDIAKEIQERLYKEHKLPVSIGIAPNLFLAKMASDMKKPLGITVLRKRDVEEKLWPLPIEDMYGIGKKTYPNLKLIGINTIGELVNYQNIKKLKLVLGNRTEEFVAKGRGIDNKIVDPHRHVESKSIGTSSTYSTDIHEYQDVLAKLVLLTKNVVNRLIDDDSIIKTISIQVRYNDFSQINRSKTLDFYTDNFYEIYQVVEQLYDDNQGDLPIRLLGVSLANIKDNINNFRQIDIFSVSKEKSKEERVLNMLNNINEAYGSSIIEKGVKKRKNPKK